MARPGLDQQKLWLGNVAHATPGHVIRGWLEDAGCSGLAHVRMFHRNGQLSSAILQFESETQCTHALQTVEANPDWGLIARYATLGGGKSRDAVEAGVACEVGLWQQRQQQQWQQWQQQQHQQATPAASSTTPRVIPRRVPISAAASTADAEPDKTVVEEVEEVENVDAQQSHEYDLYEEQIAANPEEAEQEVLQQESYQHLAQDGRYQNETQEQINEDEAEQTECEDQALQQSIQDEEQINEDEAEQTECEDEEDATCLSDAALRAKCQRLMAAEPATGSTSKFSLQETEYMQTLRQLMEAKQLRATVGGLIRNCTKRKRDMEEDPDLDIDMLRAEVIRSGTQDVVSILRKREIL